MSARTARAFALGLGWGLALAAAPARAGGPRPGPDARTPEARALAYLAREVPRWSRENHCYSCHNNGDAARALYEALRSGVDPPVPAAALADTTRWLTRPEGWDRNGGEGPFSDKRLARVQFASALSAAVAAGAVADRGPLDRAAGRLADDQAADGSWPVEGDAVAPGSPAGYGRALATFVAREVLRAADPGRHRGAVERADRWLLARPTASVMDASIALLTLSAPGRAADTPATADLRRRALARLRAGQSDDGGWGPYVDAPPEPFDTALALLALAGLDPEAEARPMVARGRAFLAATQRDDGSWPETTRPAGAESYAERLSTAGWATRALLATRPGDGR
jgi:hypothetical protein